METLIAGKTPYSEDEKPKQMKDSCTERTIMAAVRSQNAFGPYFQ